MAKKMKSGPALRAWEEYVDRLTAPGAGRELPGGVAVVVDKDGIIYQYTSGTQSLKPSSPLSTKPFDINTTMWIASCTKLMTAICALQCVEKGLLDLDADITTLIPEYKDAQVLTGFADDGSPKYRPAKGKITLRMLLSHQAGMGYTFTAPILMKYVEWQATTGLKVPSKTQAFMLTYHHPLIADPSTRWVYSSAIDWAGLMISRATGMPLESYMRANIWSPLHMPTTTFRVQSHPTIVTSRCDMAMRPPAGRPLIPSPTRLYPDNCPDDSGGGGAFSSPADYVRLLSALLAPDCKGLLKPESRELLFTGALGPAVQASFDYTLYGRYPGNENGEVTAGLVAGMGPEARPTFGFGGMVTGADGVGRRRAGSVSWGGLPNLLWMVDRKAGVGIFWGSQLLPMGDLKTVEMWRVLEEAVYKDIVGKEAGGAKL